MLCHSNLQTTIHFPDDNFPNHQANLMQIKLKVLYVNVDLGKPTRGFYQHNLYLSNSTKVMWIIRWYLPKHQLQTSDLTQPNWTWPELCTAQPQLVFFLLLADSNDWCLKTIIKFWRLQITKWGFKYKYKNIPYKFQNTKFNLLFNSIIRCDIVFKNTLYFQSDMQPLKTCENAPGTRVSSGFRDF